MPFYSNRNFKQLCIALSCALLLFLTGCGTQLVEEITVAPNGDIVLVREVSAPFQAEKTDIVRCTEDKSSPSQLNCRSYNLNIN
jgi:hypothetical protein